MDLLQGWLRLELQSKLEHLGALLELGGETALGAGLGVVKGSPLLLVLASNGSKVDDLATGE